MLIRNLIRKEEFVYSHVLEDISLVITLITSADPVLERKPRLLPPYGYIDISQSLIAIALGRFRMTVPDCKYEYRNLGKTVFGKPQMIDTLRFTVGNRFKYKASKLESMFKEVAKRRDEQPRQDHGRITFPSGPGLCTT